MRSPVEVPVLIVGGGPVGMLTAVGLRHFGIDCMVVERHASTLEFPKGRRVNTRTVEIFRQWGLEAAVAGVSLPRAGSLYAFEGETLLGPRFRRRGLPVDDSNPASPTRELICSQESLEPVLRAHALNDGADLRFLTELVRFTDDDDGVSAYIDTRGGPSSVRASYLVAADGVRGLTRETLGIGRSGPGVLGSRLSILFEADIEVSMAERQSAIYWLEQPRPGSLVLAVDNKRRWLLVVPHDPDTEPPASLTPQHVLDLVRGGLGADEVEPHYLDHRIWEPTALVADRFRSGRVFLAGDAAHVTTPEGGLGMNCGVADAHNLAWKLAGALTGWADPALLDTYEAERRPHAMACMNASLGAARPPNPIDGLVLGHTYESAAIIGDHTAPPSTQDPVGEYLPVGRPGHRAPHFWLDDGRSTLDLFGISFVALTDTTGERMPRSVTDIARAAGIPLAVHTISDTRWRHLYGLEPGGVVLVRPDGYIAWRSTGPCGSAELVAAIGIATGHNQPRPDEPAAIR